MSQVFYIMINIKLPCFVTIKTPFLNATILKWKREKFTIPCNKLTTFELKMNIEVTYWYYGNQT